MRSRIGRQWQVHDPLPWLQQLWLKRIPESAFQSSGNGWPEKRVRKIDFKQSLVAVRFVGGGKLEGPGSCCSKDKGMRAMSSERERAHIAHTH